MNQKSLDKKKPKELEWDRFVKENHTNFSKYEFYEDDLLEFITQQRTELLGGILNLECLKEWEVGEKGGNRDEVGIANFVIKQIKEEIKKL